MPYKDAEARRVHDRKFREENRDLVRSRHREFQQSEEGKTWRKMYDAKRPEEIVRLRKQSNDGIRKQMIEAYGSKCVCCGESNPAFLTVDHKNNDGADQREKQMGDRTRGGIGYYRKLRRLGWPDYIRLMCYNCNSGRAYANAGGTCPHKNIDIRGLLLLRPECFN